MSDTNKDVISKIKIEFLSLLEVKEDGYIISLEQVYTWLEEPDVYKKYSTDAKFREKFNARYLRGSKYMFKEAKDENDLGKDYFMVKNKKGIWYPMFAIRGFKTYCMIVDVPKSWYVRQHFLDIEDDYYRVLRQSKEETKAELEEVKSKMAGFESNFLKEIKRANKFEEKSIRLENKVKKTAELEVILRDEEDFATEGSTDNMLLIYLQKTFMKKVPLYIVNPEYIEKKAAKSNKSDKPKKTDKTKKVKKDDDSDSDSESDNDKPNNMTNNDAEYEQPYDEYMLNDIDLEYGESPELYYYIGGLTQKNEKAIETYNKVHYISVLDMQHLKEIKARLDTDELVYDKYCYKTVYKSIYKVSYTTIKDISSRIIKERLRSDLTK